MNSGKVTAGHEIRADMLRAPTEKKDILWLKCQVARKLDKLTEMKTAKASEESFLTKPKLGREISESVFVIRPIPLEVHAPVKSSLKYLLKESCIFSASNSIWCLEWIKNGEKKFFLNFS